MKRTIKIILLIISISLFCFFTYKIASYLISEKQSKDLNQKLIDIAIKEVKIDQSTNQEEILPIEVDFKKLKEINSDIVGWIYSEDTPINYPIVQGKDNEYYLKRLVDKKSNDSGTLFLDYRNNKNFEDTKNIIYGHNMKNGTMFGTLPNYKNQEYYNEHKKIYLFTENQNYAIQIFAGYTLSDNSSIYELSEKMNQNKIEEAKQKSDFKSDYEVSDKDTILILSTCSYDYNGARYVIYGNLKPVS